jgi:hypothetical protein
MHKKRPYSTISLKVSYLIYLLTFLFLAYFLLFFSRLKGNPDENTDTNDLTIYYLAMILAFLLPNIGIMLRRKIKKLRTQYNIIFTAINIFITGILLFFIFTIPGEF